MQITELLLPDVSTCQLSRLTLRPCSCQSQYKEGTCNGGKGEGEREQDLLFQWKAGTGLAELLLL